MLSSPKPNSDRRYMIAVLVDNEPGATRVIGLLLVEGTILKA